MEPRTLTQQLVEQFDWHWREIVRRRLDDLTDEEFLWEPVPNCWSVRPRDKAMSPDPQGTGDYVLDSGPDQSPDAPVTTIAWRLGHLAMVFGVRASNHFGDGTLSEASTEWQPTAAGGLAIVDEHYERWFDAVSRLDDQGLAEPVGPAEGPYAEAPYSDLILHLNREGIHHAAEVLLLRDLYRTSFGRR